MHLSHSPVDPPAPLIKFEQFLAVDIRIGMIVQADRQIADRSEFSAQTDREVHV